ncbi:MAG TPA: hypothetical protein VF609_03885, partial [Flavisolibacter sp.]
GRRSGKPTLLLKLVGGELKDVETKISNADLTRGLQEFAFYNAVIFVIALTLGRAIRYLVRKRDIHSTYEILRLHNRWWYLFNGYYLTEIGMDKQDYDLLFADAVVDTHDGTLIYSGYLVEFVCNGEELDRIYLNDTIRRELKKKQVEDNGKEILVNEPGEAVAIPGEFFCIAYKDIKNLNLRFISFDNSLHDIEDLPDDFPGNEDMEAMEREQYETLKRKFENI